MRQDFQADDAIEYIAVYDCCICARGRFVINFLVGKLNFKWVA